MGLFYEPLLQRMREYAEQNGRTDILQLSEKEQVDIIRTVYQDLLIIQNEKELEAKKIRCERLCEAVKNIIDGFYDSQWSGRAIDFVMRFCDRCLVTFAVEYDMPLHFYVEMIEIGECKIAIDSLLDAVVAEFDSDVILELSLSKTFMEDLCDEILSRVSILRECGTLNVVERYKDLEYTVELVN